MRSLIKRSPFYYAALERASDSTHRHFPAFEATRFVLPKKGISPHVCDDICSTSFVYDIMPNTQSVCFHRDEQTLPRISQFFGIIIAMYYNDHAPPHFHARYGEHEALLSIESLDVIEGEVPGRVLAMVLEWASLHRSELRTKLGTSAARIAS